VRADLGLPARAYGDESHKPDDYTGLTTGSVAAPALRIAG